MAFFRNCWGNLFTVAAKFQEPTYEKTACALLLYCRNSPFPALLAQNPPHNWHRRFDSAFLKSVQAQDKSHKNTGKTDTVEMKAVKYKAAETVWSFYDGGHFGYSYLLYRTLSASTSRKKFNPTLCRGRADLTEITAELLRDRDAQRPLDGCGGGVCAHSRELFPKLFAQEQLKQTLNQRNRESWASGMGKSPWVELRHDQSSRSGANCSGIMAHCLSALRIPSYGMDVSHNLPLHGHAVHQSPSFTATALYCTELTLLPLPQPFNLHTLIFLWQVLSWTPSAIVCLSLSYHCREVSSHPR